VFPTLTERLEVVHSGFGYFFSAVGAFVVETKDKVFPLLNGQVIGWIKS
jgi:hypothetical protein